MSAPIKCDVAIVGGGPVGLATACTLAALTSPEEGPKICVFEKRQDATRDHALRIQKDSIDALVRSLENSPFKNRCQQLIEQFKAWRGRSIPTTEIQDKLAALAHSLGVVILKGEQYGVQSADLTQFIQTTEAKIVIGADGARSQVREGMGARREKEYTLGYLLELKYKTPEVRPRKMFESSTQFSKAEGFDFETIGKKKPSNHPTGVNPEGLITVSMHKFIDEETHRSLKTSEVAETGAIERGSSEHPWDLETFQKFATSRPKAKVIQEHFDTYFETHYYANNYFDVSHTKIITFPLAIYRSSNTAKMHGKSVVLLAGDASSGMVLERGVNKGFIEAALCAQAVAKFLQRCPLDVPITALPKEFEDYQNETRVLFSKESRYAIFKFKALKFGEFLLSCIVRPCKWLIGAFTSLIQFSSRKNQAS